MICQILRTPERGRERHSWDQKPCLVSFQTQGGVEQIPRYTALGLCAQIAQPAMTCIIKTPEI